VRTLVVRAIDCDITDPELAVRVPAFIVERITLPKRTRGNNPKFLLAFRLAGEFRKRAIITAAGKIEFLADGQQFVAAGRHPSGACYERLGGLPLAIPTLSAAQFEELWAALAAEFGTEPLRIERPASVGPPGNVLTAVRDDSGFP
jgi:hypothetical protein